MKKSEKFLIKVNEIFDEIAPSKINLNKKQIEEYNKGLSPKDFKIYRGHTLDEYFRKYGNKLKDGKILAYRDNELWLMNQNSTYWRIQNDSDFVYFEVPNSKKLLFISLLVVAASAGGITAGVLLNKSIELIPLKITATEDDSSISFIASGLTDIDIQYSNDGHYWGSWGGAPISLNSGESILVKNNTNTLSIDTFNYFQFIMSGKISVSGDISSMINYSDLTPYCYNNMFSGCSLINAPTLPATTLAAGCYYSMFSNCTSLTVAPELPATTLADKCYYSMFQDCTNLKIREEIGTTTGEGKIFTCPSIGGLSSPVDNMFDNTNGDFTSTPTGGNTYYCY